MKSLRPMDQKLSQSDLSQPKPEEEDLKRQLPELEYSEHCGCCIRNKITVEMFGKSLYEI